MSLIIEFERQGNWLFKRRGYLPILALVVGMILFLRTEMHPGIFFIQDTPYEIWYDYLCLAVSLFGLAIRMMAVGYSKKNTSGRNVHGQVADSLNTRGLYSTIRHPLYLGNFFMWLGPALLTGHPWFIVSFCFLFWIYYERIMFAEEQFLIRKFKEAYTTWAEKTPAFIPDLRKYVRPDTSFSWRKVLNREKTGIMLVFLLFSAYDFLGETIEKEHQYNYLLYTLLLLSLISYITIKIHRRMHKTS